jgi:hypothetical protein
MRYRNRVIVAATCATLGWPLTHNAGVIVQTAWTGGSEDAARIYFTATDQSGTLTFDPFDTLDGTRELTGIDYRIHLVATQDWVADNDFDQPTIVYATMTRRVEVHMPADVDVYDSGLHYAESDPFPLAADTLPDGSPDVDRTPTNQDTTGWQTFDVDWGWSTSRSLDPADFDAFIDAGPVSVTLYPTRLLWGTTWEGPSGESQVQFRDPGMGMELEITYTYEHAPEPSALTLAGCVVLFGLSRRRRRGV